MLSLVRKHTLFLQTRSIFWSKAIKKKGKTCTFARAVWCDGYRGQGAGWLFHLKHADLLLKVHPNTDGQGVYLCPELFLLLVHSEFLFWPS